MILTVTLNTALDITYRVRALRPARHATASPRSPNAPAARA